LAQVPSGQRSNAATMEENTPLLVSKANPASMQAAEASASGSLWDALGPVTSAIVTLPVLLAH